MDGVRSLLLLSSLFPRLTLPGPIEVGFLIVLEMTIKGLELVAQSSKKKTSGPFLVVSLFIEFRMTITITSLLISACWNKDLKFQLKKNKLAN